MVRQKPVSITHPEHFVNVARRVAARREGRLFSDQFENLANFRAHLDTGREIWEQTGGKIDAFVCGAGKLEPQQLPIGGTIPSADEDLAYTACPSLCLKNVSR